ncbi:unnamed protein product [Brassica oleracea var. botrytis]
MASLGLWKKVATPLPSGWKMACTTVAAPFSSTVENSDPIKAEKVGKMKVFQKLKSLTVETIDLILKEEEKKGVYVTQTDLVRWAKRIDKRNNRPENSRGIYICLILQQLNYCYYFLVLDFKLFENVLRVCRSLGGWIKRRWCFLPRNLSFMWIFWARLKEQQRLQPTLKK